MSASRRVLVPRLADAANFNPQNQNAKALLKRFRDSRTNWSMVHYNEALPEISCRANIRLTKLLPRHLWKANLAVWYQQPASAVFYPGAIWADEWGLRARAWAGRRVPLISTLEGLVGTPERERQLTEWAGHPVHCQRVDPAVLRRLDFLYQHSDHVIAISPFLARMGSKLYGDKFSVHMLGVEADVFAPPRHENRAMTVINIAGFQPHKRPEMFLELAGRFPEVNFVWFGDGPGRVQLISAAEQRGLNNLRFPGSQTPAELARALQSASVFAIPSNSEGVPKVTQEAAACGLPIVAYGYYETPTVVDGQNGFVVWSDDEFHERVGALISDRLLAHTMGERGTQMARQWNWDLVAPEWEREILDHLSD